jgi:hypothetical protein
MVGIVGAITALALVIRLARHSGRFAASSALPQPEEDEWGAFGMTAPDDDMLSFVL